MVQDAKTINADSRDLVIECLRNVELWAGRKPPKGNDLLFPRGGG